jgi:hypothetical protein
LIVALVASGLMTLTLRFLIELVWDIPPWASITPALSRLILAARAVPTEHATLAGLAIRVVVFSSWLDDGLRGLASRPSQSSARSRFFHRHCLDRNDGRTPYAIDRGHRHEERPSLPSFRDCFAGFLRTDHFDLEMFDWSALTRPLLSSSHPVGLPTNLPIATFYFLFFWNFSVSRKVTGTDDFEVAFGFTDLKNRRIKKANNCPLLNATGWLSNGSRCSFERYQWALHRLPDEQWLPDADGWSASVGAP